MLALLFDKLPLLYPNQPDYNTKKYPYRLLNLAGVLDVTDCI
jgi:hypothetical protein